MSNYFVPNPNLDAELARLPGQRAELKRAANIAGVFAVGIAPRGATDHYVRSIGVVEVAGDVYLRTNDFAGHLVEFGSVNNPPYAVLRRAVRAAGLRLDETSR